VNYTVKAPSTDYNHRSTGFRLEPVIIAHITEIFWPKQTPSVLCAGIGFSADDGWKVR
jgi:hypothetical protein